MPRLPHARVGETLFVRKRELPFSFFPVTRGIRRTGLFDTLFAVSPWAVMRAAVQESVPPGTAREEAQAFIEQAQDFHSAAVTALAANPLLFYYAFLNVGKALIRTRAYAGSMDVAMHGLSAQTATGGIELRDSELIVRDSGGLNVYSELLERLGFPRPANGTIYPVTALLPQVVIGHRLWRQGQRAKERFVAVEDIQIVSAPSTRELWLRLYILRGDLSRYDISRRQLLDEGDLVDLFHEVQIGDTEADPAFLCLEQISPATYTGRPTDVVMDLVT